VLPKTRELCVDECGFGERLVAGETKIPGYESPSGWDCDMKLHYYRGLKGVTNFGDELNPWIWDRLLPGVFDEDDRVIFVGIGTLLNDKMPAAHRTIVFGSGVGYGGAPPRIDDSWRIYCLRGPQSAKALGLPEELAVTDPGALVRRLYTPAGVRKTWKFAYMPHIGRANAVLERTCQEMGFGYIDPRRPVDSVLNDIAQTEILISEALHGAVVADALRIPWIPVRTGPNVLQSKWVDWCATIGLRYHPSGLPRVWVGADRHGAISALARWSRRKLVGALLRRLALTARPMLSDDALLERLTVELEDRLERFRKDLSAGYLSFTQ
jgi:succinoglycan biosynthesis protein ExoV